MAHTLIALVAVRESLHLMQKIFPVRQCEDSVYANRSRPCLMYQIGVRSGLVLTGLISDEEYVTTGAISTSIFCRVKIAK